MDIELDVVVNLSRKHEDAIHWLVEKQTKQVSISKTRKDAKNNLIGLLKFARWKSSKLMS